MENILNQNQPRDQAGFRRKFSTIDHIYTLNQIIKKTNEYNLPLCVGYETYVQILENIYRKATVSMHIDDLVSEKFPNKEECQIGRPNFSEIILSGDRNHISNGRP